MFSTAAPFKTRIKPLSTMQHVHEHGGHLEAALLWLLRLILRSRPSSPPAQYWQ